MNGSARLLTGLLFLILLAGPASAQTGKKIYISADLEGVAGVVNDAQLSPTGFEYSRFREFLTSEVNAAIEGARAGGATEILVSDSHGNGLNLLIERLPEDVLVVRSWPRPLAMMDGIDESFDGAIFLGYHTSTHNMDGVRAHTMSSANLTRVSLNGMPVSEAVWNAAIAGHFDVPIIMITGDNAIVAEARETLPDIEGAVVKQARGFHSAITMTPAAALNVIRDAAERAVRRIGDFQPYKLGAGPVQVDLSLKNYQPIELLGYLSIVERIDSHSVRYMAKDMTDAAMFMQFVLNYSVSISP
ncbi:MAG: D-amino peptidase [Rhodothermales bacterium]|jgi:D-amino peptidase